MGNRTWVITGVSIALVSIGVLVFDAIVETRQQHRADAASATESLPSTSQPKTDRREAPNTSQQPITPIPTSINVNKPVARVGWHLFRDPNLSSNHQVSCESCHSLKSNGAETIPVSVGVGGRGIRNSLTVFNTAYNYRFFWDGRVNSLEAQLDGPIHNVVEMDSNWQHVSDYVASSQHYETLFNQANLSINTENIKLALVEFMSALTTPNSPFDQFLLGDNTALTEQQRRGWELFQQEGCIRCHRGINIGGGMVMRFGVFGEATKGADRSSDTGRHLSTSKAEDMYLFRVASLRNVSDTAPYFHDGQTQTLEDAIKIMAESQLGKTFDDTHVADLKAFLESLSGQHPAILQEFENE
ncbi:cytochrome-c peroxidase [Thaumasiovibrio subtropicus]|uniref:cytochrome-c peroxidase n=1 Tax=Thaumasiovibrio subtropicus TaxID=1891207 RepID=UPI000B35E7B9|nr:cytochrome c peroxidase [Thaumasiovibrio subtropicus]